jgi:hypothetical protein
MKTKAPFPPEVYSWEGQRVIVLVDADQFFMEKHMQRCAELPASFELYFFSCTVYPSGAEKPPLRYVNNFCAEVADRIAFHETTSDTTKDAADRMMVSRAQQLLHVATATESTGLEGVPFIYVTNDNGLARQLACLLWQHFAVHWRHLHLFK